MGPPRVRGVAGADPGARRHHIAAGIVPDMTTPPASGRRGGVGGVTGPRRADGSVPVARAKGGADVTDDVPARPSAHSSVKVIFSPPSSAATRL